MAATSLVYHVKVNRIREKKIHFEGIAGVEYPDLQSIYLSGIVMDR